MSGRYNFRYGMQSGVLETGQRFGLDLGETTLPQALKAAQQATAGVQSDGANGCAGVFRVGLNCGAGGLPHKAPMSNITTPSGCCNACAEDDQCAVWTMYKGNCYLKSEKCTPQWLR